MINRDELLREFCGHLRSSFGSGILTVSDVESSIETFLYGDGETWKRSNHVGRLMVSAFQHALVPVGTTPDPGYLAKRNASAFASIISKAFGDDSGANALCRKRALIDVFVEAVCLLDKKSGGKSIAVWLAEASEGMIDEDEGSVIAMSLMSVVMPFVSAGIDGSDFDDVYGFDTYSKMMDIFRSMDDVQRDTFMEMHALWMEEIATIAGLGGESRIADFGWGYGPAQKLLDLFLGRSPDCSL